MSNARKARRHLARAQRPRIGTYTRVAATAGNEPAIELEEAKRLTHDGLVLQLGHRRRSGISWMVYAGEDRDRVVAQLDAHHAEPGIAVPASPGIDVTYGDYVEGFDGLKEWLEGHPAAVLVVALCEGIK